MCFKEATFSNLNQIFGTFMFLLQTDGDQKQCILDHLKDAIKYVQKSLSDALSGNNNDLSDDFQKILDDLNFALNSC